MQQQQNTCFENLIRCHSVTISTLKMTRVKPTVWIGVPVILSTPLACTELSGLLFMIWMVSTLHAVNTQICHKHWDEAAQSEVTICFPLEIKRLIASATVYARSHLFTGLFSSASLMLMVQPVVCCDCEIISVAGATETLDGISSLQVKRVWKQRGKRGAFWMGLYNYSFAVCVFSYFSYPKP